MNNLVNGIIVLAVITALVLSIIALVYPCKSQFEDSDAVPIIANSTMKYFGIRNKQDGNNIPCDSQFEDSEAVPIIVNSFLEDFYNIRTKSDGTKIPYGQTFKNDGYETGWIPDRIRYFSSLTSTSTPPKLCELCDMCYFTKG